MEQKLPRRAARENAFIAAFSTSFDVGTLEEVIEFSRQDGEYRWMTLANRCCVPARPMLPRSTL